VAEITAGETLQSSSRCLSKQNPFVDMPLEDSTVQNRMRRGSLASETSSSLSLSRSDIGTSVYLQLPGDKSINVFSPGRSKGRLV